MAVPRALLSRSRPPASPSCPQRVGRGWGGPARLRHEDLESDLAGARHPENLARAPLDGQRDRCAGRGSHARARGCPTSRAATSPSEGAVFLSRRHETEDSAIAEERIDDRESDDEEDREPESLLLDRGLLHLTGASFAAGTGGLGRGSGRRQGRSCSARRQGRSCSARRVPTLDGRPAALRGSVMVAPSFATLMERLGIISISTPLEVPSP